MTAMRWNPRFYRRLRRGLTALVLAAIAPTVLDANTRLTAPVLMRVSHTGSMRPLLKGGELVAVSKQEFATLKVGDLVIIWYEGRQLHVIHQIIERRATLFGLGYATKGLSNPERDRVILTADNYVGTAVKL